MVSWRAVVLGVLGFLFAEFATEPLARWLEVTEWQLIGLVALATLLYLLVAWIIRPEYVERSFKRSWNRGKAP
jgi:hypothetical protein